MATFFPIIPLPWHALVGYLSAFPAGSVVLVDQDGRAQYPDEWAHGLRHYRPADHERYAVAQRQVLLVDAAGRFLMQRPMWTIKPAPEAVTIERGFNEAFVWSLADDDRLTFLAGASRLVYRLMPYMDTGMLEPVMVYKAGTWGFETESRAHHLADRIAERLSIHRGQGQRTASKLPDRLSENISIPDDEGHAA